FELLRFSESLRRPPPAMAHIPVTCIGESRRFFWCTMRDLVNSPARPVHAVIVVAFAEIAPIAHIDAAVRPRRQRDAAEPRVVAGEEVRRALGDVTAVLAFEDVGVEPVAVDFAKQHLAAPLGGEVVALIDESAGVGVAAARIAVNALASARGGPVAPGPV